MTNVLVDLAAILEISIFFLVALMIWAGLWKGIALWRAGRNNHSFWFIILFLSSTLGLLPILYLLFFQPKKKVIKRKIRRHVSRV